MATLSGEAEQGLGAQRLRGVWSARLHRPIIFYIALLLLISIVPTFIFAMAVLYRSIEAQDKVVTSLLKASTISVNQIVDQKISGMMTTLKVLSSVPTLKLGDYAGFRAHAVQALEGTGSNLILIGRDHRQLLNTRVPFGSKLNAVSDPDSVEAAFKANTTIVSDVFFGKTAKAWVFNVYQPVSLVSGEQALLTLTQNAENMDAAVHRDSLSAGWNAALIDKRENVIVSSDSKEATGKSFFMDIVPALHVGIGEASHNGIAYRVVTDFSAISGWKIIAWAKQSDVDAPALSSFLWLSLGGFVITIAAASGAAAIARLLSRGVKHLARDAERVGAGERIKPRTHMIAEVEAVSFALSNAAAARAKAENEIRFLMREVAHRSKNQLTVIQAMLNQSAALGDNSGDFAEGFRKRVAGLAKSTDLMIANAAQGVDLRELATNQLQPFLPDAAERLKMSGPSFRLDAQASQTFGMALHELATNASKYGAYANQSGVVTLDWRIRDQKLFLTWRESGADVAVPADGRVRKGFGSTVLERMLGMALGAELEREMHADGIEWRFIIPLDRLTGNLNAQ
ncbi:sensor histidine kinase [Pararhizobium sp.]|uniref:sensor histidine kinase n=1 Tax=Pararhizobium sp. TaxID=1977563 RepID=UPI00271976DC|nr:sensor histidine kinase [Pararhizobium sp.]MDO9417630.1 sensor histidine kinase [Pararhizobium sp.]